LAVEVVSPSESAADVDRKVDVMLAHGSKAVWVAFPRSKKVQVYLADGTSFSRGMNGKLSLSDLVPGWELPVATLFE
jgi:Uma2 family endonuclease